MGRANIENLIPNSERTPEQLRAQTRKGGIKSGEARREKKRMSQILADYLQKEHEVVLRDDDGAVIDREKIPAEELIQRTITAIMAREDSASASMIKTIADVTEGSKVELSGLLETSALTPEERKARISELEKKRGGK